MTVSTRPPETRRAGAPYIEDDSALAADIRRRLSYLPEDAVTGLDKNAVPYAIKARPYLAIRQQMINALVGDYYSPREIRNRMPRTNQLFYMAYLLFGTADKLDLFARKNRDQNDILVNKRNMMLCLQCPEPRHIY